MAASRWRFDANGACYMPSVACGLARFRPVNREPFDRQMNPIKGPAGRDVKRLAIRAAENTIRWRLRYGDVAHLFARRTEDIDAASPALPRRGVNVALDVDGHAIDAAIVA